MDNPEKTMTGTAEVRLEEFCRKIFEDNIAGLPQVAVREIIDETKQGRFPQTVPVDKRKKFYRVITIFESLLDQDVIRITPIKFGNAENYKWPNFQLVRRKKPYPYIRVSIHPFVWVESHYDLDLEPLKLQKQVAQAYLVKTIAGTVGFYQALIREAHTSKDNLK